MGKRYIALLKSAAFLLVCLFNSVSKHNHWVLHRNITAVLSFLAIFSMGQNEMLQNNHFDIFQSISFSSEAGFVL